MCAPLLPRLQVLEETGFAVAAADVERVTSFISAVGISGARQTIFAAEVADADGDGGGGGAAAGESATMAAPRCLLSLLIMLISDYYDGALQVE